MPTITFQPTTTTQIVDWSSADIWTPATVPNSSDDDVIIPTIYSGSTPYNYNIQIDSGDSFSIGSLALQANDLVVNGALAVSGDVDIANGAMLEIGANETTQFGAVVDNGTIRLNNDQNFDPASLTIGDGGKIDGAGTINGPIVNNGLIDADMFTPGDNPVSDTLVVDSSVSGQGSFEIEGFTTTLNMIWPAFGYGSLELAGAQTQNVVFADGLGTLQLDDPAGFTGHIIVPYVLQSPATKFGSQTLVGSFGIVFEGIPYSSVTGWSYKHRGTSGVLTIDTTGGDYSYAFSGNLKKSDFSLAAGPQALSTEVGVTPEPLADVTSSDFNGDGLSDILWRNTTSGDATIWNTTAASYSPHDLGDVGSDWQVAGVGDFNGSGYDGILWRNADGELTTWNALSSGHPEAFAGVGATYSVSNDWQVAGVGDFNGDGLSDILWLNSNGDMDIWRARPGSSPTSFTAEKVKHVSNDWQIEGVGDFNGAGKDGILWWNASADEVNIWYAEPSTHNLNTHQTYAAPGPGWTIAGVGDFTGRGQDDILWRNANDLLLWVPSGGAENFFQSVKIRHVGANEQIQGVGDYNGDGLADILWRNSNTGDVSMWESSGTASNGGTPSFTIKDLGVVSADWQISTAASLRSA